MSDSLREANSVRVTDTSMHATQLDALCVATTRAVSLTNVTGEPSSAALLELLSDVVQTRLTALQAVRVFGVRSDGCASTSVFRGLRARASSLTVLNVCDMDLGDDATESLAALCVDSVLAELWAAGNRFTVRGVDVLCAAVAAKSCRLLTLSLGNNVAFDDACGERLAEALARNRTLTRIYLSGTHVTRECRERMVATLWERNVTLLEVDPHIRWVDSAEGRLVDAFRSLLSRNASLPRRSVATERLITVAVALAELDLSVLEVIEVFDAIDDGFEFVPPLFTKWAICALIKRRFREKEKEQT